MYYLKIFLVLVLLTACKSPTSKMADTGDSLRLAHRQDISDDSTEIPKNDPYFLELVGEFIRLSDYYRASAISSVSISFGDTSQRGNRVIGYCQISGSNRFIIINKTFWDSADGLTRESLLFHELGHCMLNRAHVYAVRPERNMWPTSLMNGYVVRSDIYGADFAYYRQELFSVSLPKLDFSNGSAGKPEIAHALELHEHSNGCDAIEN